MFSFNGAITVTNASAHHQMFSLFCDWWIVLQSLKNNTLILERNTKQTSGQSIEKLLGDADKINNFPK